MYLVPAGVCNIEQRYKIFCPGWYTNIKRVARLYSAMNCYHSTEKNPYIQERERDAGM